MSGQMLAAFIMFTLTIGFGALFSLPAILVRKANPLISFYWRGFWAFLAAIAALSGGQAVLVILGQDVTMFGTAIMRGVTASFVLFVMFGWGRLSLAGVAAIRARRLKN